MPDAGASRKRQILNFRDLGHSMTPACQPRLSSESPKRLPTNSIDARRAPYRRRCRSCQNSIPSLQQEGFCNLASGGVEPDCRDWQWSNPTALPGARRAAIRAPRRKLTSPMDSSLTFVAKESLRSRDSGVGRGAQGGKRRSARSRHQSGRQMELIENSVAQQRLAMKVRSRLRVICATPFQKRIVRHRSKRFLYCVCRSLR